MEQKHMEKSKLLRCSGEHVCLLGWPPLSLSLGKPNEQEGSFEHCLAASWLGALQKKTALQQNYSKEGEELVARRKTSEHDLVKPMSEP